MKIFSLDEQVVVEAVRQVSPGWGVGGAGAGASADSSAGAEAGVDVDASAGAERGGSTAESAADRFARATWSGVAEPGDGVAGLLVAALGASAGLSCLVEQRSRSEILGALAAVGVVGPSAKEMDAALERWRPRLSASSTLTAMRQAARCGARLVVPGDSEWPESLGDLGYHQPVALWVRGRPGAALGLNHAIAIVGARAATGYGEHMAMELSAGLSDRGYGIASGAAYGIDGMAHRSALATSGQTFAFLAGGVDRFYPSGHDALLTRIAEVGAVLSELPCGAAPTKWRFLQRNRLIAAAAQAVVVVEAGVRSGSLNTAAHAATLGRPLGAVPGPVTSPSSAGCHRLLRDYNAVCVTTPEEVVELVGPEVRGQPMLELEGFEPRRSEGGEVAQPAGGRGQLAVGWPATSSGGSRRSAEQVRVLDAISRRSPRSTEEIAKRAGLSVASAQAALGSLGLERAVEEREGGWCSMADG